MPDGTLLSLPIPSNDDIMYKSVKYGRKSYYDIIKELKNTTRILPDSKCHLDPDINYDCYKRSIDWTGAFGQKEAALRHLQNNNISKNDIFLLV
jgi:hypothetical protein